MKRVISFVLTILIIFNSTLTTNTLLAEDIDNSSTLDNIDNQEETIEEIEVIENDEIPLVEESPITNDSELEEDIYNEDFFYGQLEDSIDKDMLTHRKTFSLQKASAYPTSYDLRDYGYVTSIKNQGYLGTCWAHTAVASAESYALKHNVTNEIDLSELQIAYFVYHNYGIADKLSSITNDGTSWSGVDNFDEGGNVEMSTFALASNVGYTNDSDLPYSEADADKTYDSSLCYSEDDYYVKNVEWYSMSETNIIKEALMKDGGLYVSYYDDHYNSSYYNSLTDAYYYPSKTTINHAVTLIGWDDNFSKDNFSIKPSGDGAWLVKNSWGEFFGDEGYFWISYYDANISNCVAGSFQIEKYNSQMNVYQYDGSSFFGHVNSPNNIYGANIYTANRNELLETVGFATYGTNVSYTIDIYKNVSTTPTSGTKVVSQSGTIKNSGYHSVALTSPVELANGDKFSIVLKLSDQVAEKVYLVIDKTSTKSFDQGVTLSYKNSVSQGQSFYSTNGTSWTDGYNQGYTARIKAYTSPVSNNKCGDNAYYTINGNTLTISGSGAMYNYQAETAPWYSRLNSIKNLVIESGITTIGQYTFLNCLNITSVVIPTSVVTIDVGAFSGCNKLSTLKFEHTSSDNLIINTGAFNLSASLNTTIYVQDVDTINNAISQYNWVNSNRNVSYYSTVTKTYTITYVLNGGINNPENLSSYTSNSPFTLNDPTKNNYVFNGWYSDAYFKNKVEIVENRDITVYAKWEAKKYLINYELDGGTNALTNKETYTYGITQALARASKPGYTFEGWYLEPEFQNKVLSIEKGTTGDITIYAKYTPNTYVIVYNANGGTGSMSKVVTTYDEEVPLATNAYNKLGYKFVGWTLSLNDESIIETETVSKLTTVPNGTATLYAKWEPIKYTIHFEANNNGVINREVMDDIEVEYNQTITLTNLYVRDGIKFSKWTGAANGKALSYSNNAKVKNLTTKENEVITLYANWTYPSTSVFKITYNLNGGKNNPSNPTSYNIDTLSFELQDPTRVGYTFDGWYTAYDKSTKEGLGDEVEVINGLDKIKYTLYAAWSPIEYTINFVSDDYQESMDCQYDQSYKLNNDIFDVDGKYVSKWTYSYTDTKGKLITKTIAGNASIKNLCIEDKDEITLSVSRDKKTNEELWTYNKYTIKYVLNSGKNNKLNKSSFTSQIPLTFHEPTRNGIEFLGWYLDPNFKEPVEDTKDIYENITLYAKWMVTSHKITYIIDEDTTNNPLNPNIYLEGASFVLSKPTKQGYTFLKWIDEDTQKPITSITTKANRDYKLKATWKENKYTITYNANGGKKLTGTIYKQSELYSDLCLLDGDRFYRDGYTLIGWSINSKAVTPDYDLLESLPNLPKTSLALYAVWEKDNY